MNKISYKNRLVGLTEDQKQYVGLDCEMVGVAPPPGYQYPTISMLAQVSIVDWNGTVIYQSYVTPTQPVLDYRTPWSGITKEDLDTKGRPFDTVQAEVLAQISGKIVVGHALENDFAVLGIDPATVDTRDTGYTPFFQKTMYDGSLGPRKLKDLVEEHLGKEIQTGEHDPAEDARAALELFKKYRYDVFEMKPFTQSNMNELMRMLVATSINPNAAVNMPVQAPAKSKKKHTRRKHGRKARKTRKARK